MVCLRRFFLLFFCFLSFPIVVCDPTSRTQKMSRSKWGSSVSIDRTGGGDNLAVEDVDALDGGDDDGGGGGQQQQQHNAPSRSKGSHSSEANPLRRGDDPYEGTHTSVSLGNTVAQLDASQVAEPDIVLQWTSALNVIRIKPEVQLAMETSDGAQDPAFWLDVSTIMGIGFLIFFDLIVLSKYASDAGSGNMRLWIGVPVAAVIAFLVAFVFYTATSAHPRCWGRPYDGFMGGWPYALIGAWFTYLMLVTGTSCERVLAGFSVRPNGGSGGTATVTGNVIDVIEVLSCVPLFMAAVWPIFAFSLRLQAPPLPSTSLTPTATSAPVVVTNVLKTTTTGGAATPANGAGGGGLAVASAEPTTASSNDSAADRTKVDDDNGNDGDRPQVSKMASVTLLRRAVIAAVQSCGLAAYLCLPVFAFAWLCIGMFYAWTQVHMALPLCIIGVLLVGIIVLAVLSPPTLRAVGRRFRGYFSCPFVGWAPRSRYWLPRYDNSLGIDRRIDEHNRRVAEVRSMEISEIKRRRQYEKDRIEAERRKREAEREEAQRLQQQREKQEQQEAEAAAAAAAEKDPSTADGSTAAVADGSSAGHPTTTDATDDTTAAGSSSVASSPKGSPSKVPAPETKTTTTVTVGDRRPDSASTMAAFDSSIVMEPPPLEPAEVERRRKADEFVIQCTTELIEDLERILSEFRAEVDVMPPPTSLK